MSVWEKCETKNFKITVECVDHDKFITTLWDKNYCLEVDREVYSFETSAGAYGKAFSLLKRVVKEAGI